MTYYGVFKIVNDDTDDIIVSKKFIAYDGLNGIINAMIDDLKEEAELI